MRTPNLTELYWRVDVCTTWLHQKPHSRFNCMNQRGDRYTLLHDIHPMLVRLFDFSDVKTGEPNLRWIEDMEKRSRILAEQRLCLYSIQYPQRGCFEPKSCKRKHLPLVIPPFRFVTRFLCRFMPRVLCRIVTAYMDVQEFQAARVDYIVTLVRNIGANFDHEAWRREHCSVM